MCVGDHLSAVSMAMCCDSNPCKDRNKRDIGIGTGIDIDIDIVTTHHSPLIRFPEAIATLSLAHSLHPSSHKTLTRLGVALRGGGRHGEGRAMLQRAVQVRGCAWVHMCAYVIVCAYMIVCVIVCV